MVKQTLQWFIDRIGKNIFCKAPAGKSGYTGEVYIMDEDSAKYQFSVSQNFLKYEFSDIQTETK